MAEFVNYFQVLGVDDDASRKEIRRAYRQAALKAHPDKAPPEGQEAATEAMKTLTKACQVLCQAGTRNNWMIEHTADLVEYFGYENEEELTYEIEEGNEEPKTGAKRKRDGDEEQSDEENGPNAPFTPEGLYTGEVMKQAGMKNGVPIGEVMSDPKPRRIIMANFNKNGAIMRRPVYFDIKANSLPKKNYPAVRGATLKRKNIIYLKDWGDITNAEEEGVQLFKALQAKGYTKDWGYSDYHHMKSATYERGHLADAHLRMSTNDYKSYRVFDNLNVTEASIKARVAGYQTMMEESMASLKSAAEKTASAESGDKIRKNASNHVVRLQKLRDKLARVIGDLMETVGEVGKMEVSDED